MTIQHSSARIPARNNKSVHDTVSGCRDFAAADLARAALMDTENGRRKLEHSAGSWHSRADMLQRLDDSFEARHAAAAELNSQVRGPATRLA